MQDFSRLRRIRFPGRAGELQNAGTPEAREELPKELGRNYAQYHQFLSRELERALPRPTRQTHPDIDDFARDWQRLQDLVVAEYVLRACFDHVHDGASLDRPPGPEHGPAVGPGDTLAKSRTAR